MLKRFLKPKVRKKIKKYIGKQNMEEVDFIYKAVNQKL